MKGKQKVAQTAELMEHMMEYYLEMKKVAMMVTLMAVKLVEAREHL